MAMKVMSYAEARHEMRPGDVIAFGGKGQFSEIIKLATRSTVSHVGTILQTRVVDDTTDRFFNQIIESTSADGVAVYRASERIARYEGEVWWLPLRRSLWESCFDRKRFFDFLFDEARARKGYDFPQAIQSAIDVLDRVGDGDGPTRNREDLGSYFCSELVAAGLEAANLVPPINASEVTPIDLCRWAIYEADYYQLAGEPREIPRFGTMDPAQWA
jgi:hypothetical protein